MGNPGTGKTEVARYIAGILYENKLLPANKVIEVDRSGLVSQYFGATAEKTRRVISNAMGGVLFIDEAYALGNNSSVGITDYTGCLTNWSTTDCTQYSCCRRWSGHMYSLRRLL